MCRTALQSTLLSVDDACSDLSHTSVVSLGGVLIGFGCKEIYDLLRCSNNL